ncbi:hypothetical protein QVD17_26294 [Tagetes erecta]|uniref:Uncharacterized protein n=1 Tax=Tagetes erecta TaxID=13708 RepID=A0AAD8K945_TARER|nr:hypothetical protein QVD17_26294 [Tagetes erecta]
MRSSIPPRMMQSVWLTSANSSTFPATTHRRGPFSPAGFLSPSNTNFTYIINCYPPIPFRQQFPISPITLTIHTYITI